MSRRGKWLVFIALGTVILVLFVPFLHLQWQMAQVRREIARIKAEGGPVSASDLVGKPVPDAANGAVVYRLAFTQTPGFPAPHDDFVVLRFLDPRDRPRYPQFRDQVARLVRGRYAKALALAEKAIKCPMCRFAIDRDELRDGIVTTLDFDRVEFLAQLLCARAIVQAQSGGMTDALASLDLAFKVSNSLRDEPGIEAAFARYEMIRQASASLVEVAGSGEINEAQARRLSRTLASIDLRTSISKAMRDERAAAISFYDHCRKNGLPAQWDVGRSEWERCLCRSPLFPTLLSQDELYYLGQMRAAIRDADLPWRVQKAKLSGRRFKPPACDILSRTLDTGWFTGFARDQAMARVAGDRLLLGLAAYRARFGCCPMDLHELGVALGWSVRDDPLSGKPFVYRRMKGGFVLYSRELGLDNHGHELPPHIVWKLGR
jgi:hypothetical protein